MAPIAWRGGGNNTAADTAAEYVNS